MNLPPHLDPVADQTLDPGLPLELLLTSTDPDLPEQTLTFALVEGPAGLSVSTKGALRWMPTAEQTPSTNQVRVLVGDGALTATTAFTVIVRDPSLPPPVLQLDADRPDGRLALEIRARLGLELILETAPNLGPWTEVQRLTGLGESMPITVILTPGSGTEPRFWRVKTQ